MHPLTPGEHGWLPKATPGHIRTTISLRVASAEALLIRGKIARLPSGQPHRIDCGDVVLTSAGHMGVYTTNGKMQSAQSGSGQVSETGIQYFPGTKAYWRWWSNDPMDPPPPPGGGC